jgi:hypothetical protein
MAYLLGLIVGRGTLREAGGLRQLIIEYPFKELKAEGLTLSYDAKDKLLLSLDSTINRLGELLDIAPKKIPSEKSCSIIIESARFGLFWRNLNKLLKGKMSFREMEVPDEIFLETTEIKKEFLRGLVDVTGSIRLSDRYRDGRYRIYISILYENWILPIQICKLLQEKPLRIPVNTIDWGHPNTRNGQLTDYKKGKLNVWAREHQLKVFAEYFLPIGFTINHKKEILKELADYNNKKFGHRKPKLCLPPKRIGDKKSRHPCETSDKLPQILKGRHFDTYWQICLALGCTQYKKEKSLFEENNV